MSGISLTVDSGTTELNYGGIDNYEHDSVRRNDLLVIPRGVQMDVDSGFTVDGTVELLGTLRVEE